MVASNRVIIVDIEASGLEPNSYPLEVGWAISGGGDGSMLIRPAASWRSIGWDDIATELHGITPEQVVKSGQDVWRVAETLNDLLSGIVLSDAPDRDGYWLDMMYAETPLQRSYQLHDFWHTAAPRLIDTSPDAARSYYDRSTRHRAKADAMLLRDIWDQTMP